MIFRNALIRFSRTILVTASLLIPLTLAFVIYVRAEKEIDHANDRRHTSYLLASELRQSSDDLTRMARTFVITGESKYKRQYQAVLDIRDGRRARPEGYSRIYWDLVLDGSNPPRPDTPDAIPLLELMRQSGFTARELAKLSDAKLKSDQLAVIEQEAMKLAVAVGPDAESSRARARLLMFDQHYHRAKADIMKPIDDFFTMMDTRTQNSIRAAEKQALLLRVLFISCAAWLTIMLWRTYRALRNTLGGDLDTLYAHFSRMGQGDFSADIAVPKQQTVSVMGWLAEMQAKLVSLEQKRNLTEDALRESEEKYRILFRDSPDAYLIIVDSLFVDCNRAAEAMLRADRVDIIGKHPKMYSPEFQPDGSSSSEAAEQRIAEALQNGSSTFEWVHRRQDGSLFHVDVSVASMMLDSKPALFVTWHDITKRKQAERELLDKNAELERFTYSVSHDLKSPLITIQSFAGQVMQDVETGRTARIGSDLTRIMVASSKMTALLNDLLELSRAGKMMGTPSLIDMERLISDVLTRLAGSLQQHQIEVVVQPGIPAAHGDRLRIATVLQNLLENAIKYRGDQPVPRITIGSRQNGTMPLFFVSDNGQGIEARFHENIFGLFNKLDNKSEGTGVGLALVKRIVEVHGGRVWVESDGLGRGSTFFFTFSVQVEHVR
ncbi:MAG TPA: PAS domain S-box protein [Desulfuromonadales bacterium]|nr:PAS domain S-box protein [Desulfuromonadales bacterium]